MDAAIKHCTAGLGIWEWASNDEGGDPDVVMACCGDVPTLETLAAVEILRQHFPELKIRVLNVVDLMTLQPQSEHPHGLSDKDFDVLFTRDKPIIFAFHGYPWLIHRLAYRRTNHKNLHVRGYKENGTTTTPFDMVVLNDLDRFHLVGDVIDRVSHAFMPVEPSGQLQVEAKSYSAVLDETGLSFSPYSCELEPDPHALKRPDLRGHDFLGHAIRRDAVGEHPACLRHLVQNGHVMPGLSQEVGSRQTGGPRPHERHARRRDEDHVGQGSRQSGSPARVPQWRHPRERHHKILERRPAGATRSHPRPRPGSA